MPVCLKGDQIRPPQDVLLCHVDYSELKAKETLSARHKHYLALEEFKWGGLARIRVITRNNFL